MVYTIAERVRLALSGQYLRLQSRHHDSSVSVRCRKVLQDRPVQLGCGCRQMEMHAW